MLMSYLSGLLAGLVHCSGSLGKERLERQRWPSVCICSDIIFMVNKGPLCWRERTCKMNVGPCSCACRLNILLPLTRKGANECTMPDTQERDQQFISLSFFPVNNELRKKNTQISICFVYSEGVRELFNTTCMFSIPFHNKTPAKRSTLGL